MEKVPRDHDYFHWAARELKKFPGVEILDVGCGDGEHLKVLWADAGIDVGRLLGVDFSTVALSEYERRGGRTSWAEVEALPFANKRFPVVLAIEILEHLDKPVVGWQEICRVCSDAVILTVPPMMDIPQHKTVRDARGWSALLGINRAPDWKGLRQVGWVCHV